jgi:hypothetical protein
MASLPDPVARPEVPERLPAVAAPARRPSRRPRPVAAPLPAAEHALASSAAEIVRSIAADTVPFRWRLAGFARDVDVARRQLGPLHDRRMLVSSFERESARLAALRRLACDPSAPPAPLDPVEAAYAVRWLELADDGAPLPAWAEWVGTERHPPG